MKNILYKSIFLILFTTLFYPHLSISFNLLGLPVSVSFLASANDVGDLNNTDNLQNNIDDDLNDFVQVAVVMELAQNGELSGDKVISQDTTLNDDDVISQEDNLSGDTEYLGEDDMPVDTEYLQNNNMPGELSSQPQNSASNSTFNATVTKIIEQTTINQNQTYQKIELTVDNFDTQNNVIIVENGATAGIKNQIYQVGDKVIVTANIISDDQVQFFISDYQRTDSIYILFAVFVLLSLIIAGKMAVRSLIAMFITFAVIFGLLLPQISQGYNAFIAVIIFSVISIPVNFYLSHGVNYKTTSAIIGTFVSLIVTTLLATFFVNYAHLTGYTTDESMFLQIAKGAEFNIKGILLAGIIVGIVGILDDITVSQASIVYQLKKANKQLNFLELFNRSMEVGRDHISSLINTLVLVYAGASLPLLLLFIDSSTTFTQVLNYEIVASEVIRTLIGSIGLVIAVPITTMVSAIATEVFGE